MGENYTAEEYRKVLISIYNMNTEEREKVFGVAMFVPSYIEDFPISELIEKYRVYDNLPKVGEYWKRKEDGEMVVIRRFEDGVVYLYLCDGGYTHCLSLEYFTNSYIKTGHKSLYLEAFLKEMKEMSK